MNPGVLFIVSSDPRESPRPAEAVRMAAGIGAWRKVAVTLCLCDHAVLALGEDAEDLRDGDHFRRYLPLVGAAGGVVCAQRGAHPLERLGPATVPFREIDGAELAELGARSHSVIRL